MLNNRKEKLREAIIKTVVFFDLFDFPLSAFELWRFCGLKCSLDEVMEILENDPGFLGKKYGFYFLPGRESIVDIRQKRYNYANRKFRRALLVARLFKFVPWIKMIAIGNQIGPNNLRDGSDIDFFIVTEPKRIWVSRWFCAGIAKILRLRPSLGKKRDTVCLSFYATSDNLKLDGLMLDSKPASDTYFVYWLANLVPIYDPGRVYSELIRENSWLKNHLPNWQKIIPGPLRDVGPGRSGFYRDFVDMLIGGADPLFKKIQLRIMPDVLHCLMNLDTRVVVNDKILKLYANDRREELREKYIDRLNTVLSPRHPMP